MARARSLSTETVQTSCVTKTIRKTVLTGAGQTAETMDNKSTVTTKNNPNIKVTTKITQPAKSRAPTTIKDQVVAVVRSATGLVGLPSIRAGLVDTYLRKDSPALRKQVLYGHNVNDDTDIFCK